MYVSRSRTLPVSCGPQEKTLENPTKPALWAVSSSGLSGGGPPLPVGTVATALVKADHEHCHGGENESHPHGSSPVEWVVCYFTGWVSGNFQVPSRISFRGR
jgi:hypothetical protein